MCRSRPGRFILPQIMNGNVAGRRSVTRPLTLAAILSRLSFRARGDSRHTGVVIRDGGANDLLGFCLDVDGAGAQIDHRRAGNAISGQCPRNRPSSRRDGSDARGRLVEVGVHNGAALGRCYRPRRSIDVSCSVAIKMTLWRPVRDGNAGHKEVRHKRIRSNRLGEQFAEAGGVDVGESGSSSLVLAGRALCNVSPDVHLRRRGARVSAKRAQAERPQENARRATAGTKRTRSTEDDFITTNDGKQIRLIKLRESGFVGRA